MSAHLPTPDNDDISRMKRFLRTPALHYHDMADQEDLRKALQRWPLLAETELLAELDEALAAPRDSVPGSGAASA